MVLCCATGAGPASKVLSGRAACIADVDLVKPVRRSDALLAQVLAELQAAGVQVGQAPGLGNGLQQGPGTIRSHLHPLQLFLSNVAC